MPEKKITVLQLINNFTMGGAEKIVCELTKMMDKTKFCILVCGVTDNTDIYTPQIVRELKEHQIISLSLNRPPWEKSVKALWRLIKIIKRYRVDLINTHCSTPDFYGRIAAIYCRLPVITTLHSVISWEKYPRLGAITEAILYPFTTQFVAVSNTVKKAAIEKLHCNHKKILVIYNGINSNRWQNSINIIEKRSELGFNKDEKLLIIVGRLNTAKGHIFLLKAMPEIIKRHPEVKLLIVGGGDLQHHLEQQVAALGLTNSIFFLGKRNDITDIYHISDIFVLSSLWEGLPLVLLEAMATGLPIVATAVGGIPDVIRNKESGLLVTPSSTPELATAILYMLEHPQEAKEMSARAKELVQSQFNISAMVRSYEELYLKYAARVGGGRP